MSNTRLENASSCFPDILTGLVEMARNLACAIFCIENEPGHGRLMISHTPTLTSHQWVAPGLWQNSPAKAPLPMQEVPRKPRKSPAKTMGSGKLGDHRPQSGATAPRCKYSKRLVHLLSPIMSRVPTMTSQLQRQSNQCSPWSRCRWQTQSNSNQRICQAQAASPPTTSYVPHCPHCRTILPARFWASVLALTASLTAVCTYYLQRSRRLSFLPIFEKQKKPILLVLCGHHPLKHPKSRHLDPAWLKMRELHPKLKSGHDFPFLGIIWPIRIGYHIVIIASLILAYHGVQGTNPFIEKNISPSHRG